jgi:hypothetical protein
LPIWEVLQRTRNRLALGYCGGCKKFSKLLGVRNVALEQARAFAMAARDMSALK